MDHPLRSARAEQHVPPVDPLPVEGDHHLPVVPFVGRERARVPDAHRSAAVLARRDVAREVEVFERMVFGPDREVVALGVDRNALRHRPRCRYAFVFEAQVPVQRPGVMLLHDEARVSVVTSGRTRGARPRLRRCGEVSLGLVLRQRTAARRIRTRLGPALLTSASIPSRRHRARVRQARFGRERRGRAAILDVPEPVLQEPGALCGGQCGRVRRWKYRARPAPKPESPRSRRFAARGESLMDLSGIGTYRERIF